MARFPVGARDDPKQMLQNALENEVSTIERYVRRRQQAEAFEEYGLAVDIDDIIADTETRCV